MDSLFEVHKLNEVGLKKAAMIAECFNELVWKLGEMGDGSTKTREFAITRSKLEEACFYAKKAMALQRENQQAV